MVEEKGTEGTKGSEGGKGGTSSEDGAAAKIIAPAAGVVIPDPDDLSKVNTSKFSDEQKDDYIEKLKDENARRRIATKKEKDKVTKLETAQAETNTKLDDLKTKLGDYEKKEKDRTDAEKSAMEKLSTQIADIEKSVSEKDTEIQKLKKESAGKDLKIEKSNRERMADRLVHSLGIEFTSEYERAGFLGELMERDGDEFKLNDEEVILKVQKFSESRQKEPPKTPGPGPKNKGSEIPLVEEVKQLMSKPDLTLEDRKRLKEIQSEMMKERAQGV